MEARTKMSEVLPFIVMVIMEGWTIGLTIFAKTGITKGMSPFVFIVYTNALATIILFPCFFLPHQEDRSLSLPLLLLLMILASFLAWSFLHGGFVLVLIFNFLFFAQKGEAIFYFLFVHAVLVPRFYRVYIHTDIGLWIIEIIVVYDLQIESS